MGICIKLFNESNKFWIKFEEKYAKKISNESSRKIHVDML